MPRIELTTFIKASPEVVFDLSRSIDVHQKSTAQTKERAIDGRTSGLCELGDFVTWEAMHLFVKQRMTVRITAMNRPISFQDEMEKGPFRSMSHIHRFEPVEGGMQMIDDFEYMSPMGILGKIANKLFLKKYMTNLLKERNRVIKEIAEANP